MIQNPFVTNDKGKTRLCFLTVGLALFLLLVLSGTIIFSSKADNANEYWTDHCASEFAGGTGYSSDPFIITSAEELALMANRINNVRTYEHYKLANNIDLTAFDSGNRRVWDPIGTYKKNKIYSPFTGTFDGQGYMISGMYINKTKSDYAGLFGYVGNGGSVSNVKMEGKILLDGESDNPTYVGGIIAYNHAYGRTISKLYSNVTINAKSQYVGGIIGYADYNYDENDNGVTLDLCMSIGAIENDGDYEDGDYAGGIVGKIQSYYKKNLGMKSTVTFNNCLNKGDVVNKKGSAGGILANFTDGNLELNNLYNSGNITSDAGNAAGIICEKPAYENGNSITMNNCSNTGSVSGKRAGGIATELAIVFLKYLSNNGDVKGDELSGGLVGSVSCKSNAGIYVDCSMSDSYNLRTVTRGNSTLNASAFVQDRDGVTLTNCTTTQQFLFIDKAQSDIWGNFKSNINNFDPYLKAFYW